MDMRKWLSVWAISLFFCAGTSLASPLYSGSISGVFTGPRLSGFNSDLGALVPQDNTLTAQYEGFGSDSIIWGMGSDPRNQLTFIPLLASPLNGEEFRRYLCAWD